MNEGRHRTTTIVAAAALVGLLLALGLPALGASGTKAELELWKASCKVCHAKDGTAKDLSPATLIGMQWERFFDKKFAKTHADLIHPEKKEPLGKVLTPETLKKLRKFLVDHAADSEQPMTCGK
ncbi:MAG: cytochrome c [Acidobacteria bacterium]|nr:MAG: cytochrome c [Acidobacteriota bacterium]